MLLENNSHLISAKRGCQGGGWAAEGGNIRQVRLVGFFQGAVIQRGCKPGASWGQSAEKGPRLSLRCFDCLLDDLDMDCGFWKRLQLITYTFVKDHDSKYISQTECRFAYFMLTLFVGWFVSPQSSTENTIHIVRLFCPRDVKNPDVFSSENSWAGLPKCAQFPSRSSPEKDTQSFQQTGGD